MILNRFRFYKHESFKQPDLEKNNFEPLEQCSLTANAKSVQKPKQTLKTTVHNIKVNIEISIGSSI